MQAGLGPQATAPYGVAAPGRGEEAFLSEPGTSEIMSSDGEASELKSLRDFSQVQPHFSICRILYSACTSWLHLRTHVWRWGWGITMGHDGRIRLLGGSSRAVNLATSARRCLAGTGNLLYCKE